MKTIADWTRKGLITGESWRSLGGRVYWEYAETEIDRIKTLMR